MLKLYEFHLDTAISVVGVYPQYSISSEEIYRSGKRDFRYNRAFAPFPDDVYLPVFRMEPHARITDYMNREAFSLVVSEKILGILQKMHCDDPQIFKIKLETPGGILDYYLFHLYKPLDDNAFFDWSQSVFYKEHKGIYTRVQYQNSEQRYNGGGGWPEKVYTRAMEAPFDVFQFRHFGLGAYYFSERFKQEIEAANIKGVYFQELRFYQNGE
ncbi:MAG: hypothetical protein J0L99_05340 [Chitinophagales bacterium]|nr:hypothetical protein [Chitinophagales bacterium]